MALPIWTMVVNEEPETLSLVTEGMAGQFWGDDSL